MGSNHTENAANISDEHAARLATTSAFLSLASTRAKIGLVAVIALRNLHFISTRTAGSPGLDGLLETVSMEDSSDARQAEATRIFPHRPRYISILNQTSKKKHAGPSGRAV